MNKTIHSVIIGTSTVDGVRELHDMENVATFDAGFADASIDPTTLHFTNAANKKVRELHTANPLECPLFTPKTDGYGIIADSKYAIDFSTMRFLSAVELEAQVFRLAGAPNFEKSAAGLSMQLLKDVGALVSTDFRNVPYVNENRKRALEQSVFALQAIQIQKSIFDEVFKLVNIAGDILSGAAVVTIPAAVMAVVNLLTTLVNLALLIKKFIELIIENRELLLPPVRLHRGISLYQYLQKGTSYLGLSLQMGDALTDICKRITLTPSKSDEVGMKMTIPDSFLDFALNTVSNPGDGLLRPSDFGYTLGEAIDLVKTKFNAKSAIKDGVYHLRWKGDPFWLNAPAYTIPNVLTEQAMDNDNGWTEYNYSDIISRYLISYAKDESDYHTLTDTNNRMAEVIYSHPITDKKRSLLKGLTDVQIPYALCVRKGPNDGIFSGVFSNISTLINSFKDTIQSIYDANPGLQQVALPILDILGIDKWNQEGALLIENHYFSTPKIVLLDNESGRIPLNFASEIGADALWTNWHSWNAMSPGWKNPSKPSETNQKIIFRNVRIPFGIKNWQKTIINSNCTVPGYGRGEFISIKWKNGADFAVCDFFAYKTWAPNLTGKLYKIAPTNVLLANPSV